LVANGFAPAWGRRGIAFARERETRQSHSAPQLWLIKRPGRRPQRFRARSGGGFIPVAWSADGRTLLTAEAFADTQARLVAVGSRNVRTLAPVLSQIDGLSRDGKLVLAEQEGNVVAVGLDGAIRLLAANAASPSWTR